MRTFCLVVAVLVGVVLSAAPASAQSPPAGFTQTTYKGGMTQITAMAWAKDGADDLLFVSQKTGQIRVIKNGGLQAANVATVTVTTNNEAGLDNVIVDPNYSTNKFIYVFACQEIGTSQWRHRVFRFTISNGASVGTSAGPTQIGPDAPCLNINHNGGGMAIGADNHLYVGIGNCGNGNNVGTDGTSGEWTSLGSKVMRINLASPTTPPADNPWIGMSDPNIKWAFAKGFRNPFGLRIRPGTSQLWMTEVGDFYEQIFVITSGSDQGWRDGGGYGGNNGTNTPPTFDNSTDGNNENNTAANNAHYGNNYLIPVLAYRTNVHPYGGCLTRGAFYTGSMFPAGYANNFFFVDYNSGRVMRAVLNGGNNGFASHAQFIGTGQPLTDINTGPDGALYYASHNGSIYRLEYSSGGSQAIQASTSAINITEGGTGTFQVKLAAMPPGNVTVNAARSGGSTDVTVTGGATLTFTTANWSTNQTVTVAAAQDADFANEAATIQLTSGGLTSVNVTVNVQDNDTGPAPMVTLTAPTEDQVVSGTNAEFYGSATTSGTLAYAEFYVDNKLKYTDPYVPATGHFHYGSSHVSWNTTALSNGKHKLMLKVFDTLGQSGSMTVNVRVDNSAGASGLRGDYFSGTNFNSKKFSRIDPLVNFDWGLESPDTSLPTDGFSIRWSGEVMPVFTETYTFFVRSDDGTRLWVNGTLIIDQWVDRSVTESSGTIGLTKDVPADIVLEYYEKTGDAVVQFSWSSASVIKGTVPASAMGTVILHGAGGGGGGSGGGGGGGGCGLTGLEGVAFLGLIAVFRRRRR